MTGRSERRLHSHSAAETEAFGARLAAGLKAGETVLVRGELGAGKTTFVRGACRALGVTAPVNSPTFTIGQRYPAPVPVAHLDLYRVEELWSEDPELLGDYLAAQAIAFIELPLDSGTLSAAVEEEVGRLSALAASVTLLHAGGDSRIVELHLASR